MKEIINSKSAPAPIGPYNQAIKAGGFLFVSGQLGIDAQTGQLADGVKAQTKWVLENIKAIIEEAGMGLQHVVKTTCYLKDMGDFVDMNEVYSQFFKENAPARAAIEVSRLPKDAMVEIECVAFLA